jgi:tether containing UBX domain for GLUT4
MFYEMPVIYVSNREIASFVDLQKTLAQIGVNSGSHLLRLHYRNEGMPLEEAMAQISEYFKEEPVPSVAEASNSAPSEAVPEAEAAGEASIPTPDAMEGVAHTPNAGPASQATSETPKVDPQPTEEPLETSTSSASIPPKRTVTVYTPPTTDVPLAALQPHNESDYIPTIDHAKIHQSRLSSLTQNKRLPSDAEIAKAAAEKQQKIAQVDRVRVRVRLPDQAQIEDTFTREDTVADLFGFVQLALRHPEQVFTLKYTDAKGKHVVLSSSKQSLIKDLGWTGSTLVYMQWGDDVSDAIKKVSALNDEHLKQAKALEVIVPKEEEAEAKKGFSVGNLLGSKDKGKGKGRADLESKLRGFLGKKK